MADKTSSIIFDDSSLLITHTGIMLTKGNIYFDNKVTLSSTNNTTLSTISTAIHTSRSPRTYSIAWSPDGKYVALGNWGNPNDIYSFDGNSLTLVTSTPGSSTAKSMAWSPDGKYLAFGNEYGQSDFYRFDGNSLVYVTSAPTLGTTSAAWSPDGNYIALVNDGVNEIYRFNGNSLVFVASTPASSNTYSIAWSPDGNYIALGKTYYPNCDVYRFDGNSLVYVTSTPGIQTTISIAWSPDANYIALGYAGEGSEGCDIYSFNGSSLAWKASTPTPKSTVSIAWSPDGNYVALGNWGDTSDIYNFDGNSLTLVASAAESSTKFTTSIAWSPDANYIALGNEDQGSDVYPITYQYDTTTQGFRNGITFGNSTLGSAYDLDVHALAAARINLYGKLWLDSVNSCWTFDSLESYLSLNRYDSKFKITNANSMNNWKNTHIIKSSENNTLFLQDNQIWETTSNGNNIAPKETFEFMDDLIIPDNQQLKLSSNAVIDGQGHNLILGKYAQLVIDNNTTVTFKNLTIKNTLSSTEKPPIWGQCFNSTICLDNVTFRLNDNYTFTSGAMFFHNNVEFTGTCKFSYRTTQTSYITQHTNLIFGPHTTFEYYPNSINKNLIHMADKTSTLIFDGSTLQTTHTGLRLINGCLHFDNNVTLSSSLTNTIPQALTNGIVFGNSALGSAYDLDVHALAAARINLYGKLWQDSVNSSWTFDSRDSYLSLNRYDSKFKITNANSMNNWKNTHIIKSSENNTLFLQDNQIWESIASNYNLAPEETFELMDDLIIPENQLVKFSSNTVFDGQGNNLILGKYAQLLVDGGITVTFKNMTIKNTLNTISCPPIRCMDWYSKACFDNVTLSFNDDFAFSNGQIFVHNDLNTTGTSKFSYRSVRPSYIAQHSNLIFNPNTTFEFYPSTSNNTLIQMTDKTSGLIFDGSMLQTTHTGIRLTKGSLYFDNKVTLSSTDNTKIYAVTAGTAASKSYGTLALAWSPDGRFLAEGNSSSVCKIYRLDGTTLSFVCNIDDITRNTNSIAWSPDGKYIVMGNYNSANTVYSFNGISCTSLGTVDIAYYTRSVAWSPDGKYLAVGNDNTGASQTNKIYHFDGSKFTYVCNVDATAYTTWSLEWRPDGKYLAVANWNGALSKIYTFNGKTCSFVCNIDADIAGRDTRTVRWSPDGIYLALANANSKSSTSKLYRFSGNTTSFVCYIDSQSDDTIDLAWSPNAKYLASATWASPGTQTDKLYRFNGNTVDFMFNLGSATPISLCVSWHPSGNFLAIGEATVSNRLFNVSYTYDTAPQSCTNGIVFGNSALGSAYDVDINVLSAANINIFGPFMYDCIS